MTDAQQRLSSGHYNSDPVSETNPGGLADGGHVVNFPAALADVGAIGAQTAADRADAAGSVASTVAARVAAEAAAASAAGAVAEIAEMAASAAEAPSIANKLNLNGSNLSGASKAALLARLGVSYNAELAAMRASDALSGAWASAARRRACAGASLMIWPEAAEAVAVDPPGGTPVVHDSLDDFPSITLTRPSKAWSHGWAGESGGVVGPLREHAADAAQCAPQGGLVIANPAENLVRNPRGEGDAAPAIPTHWAIDDDPILVVAGRGEADGWPYVDFVADGAAADAATVRFEGYGTATTTAGAYWSFGVNVALVEGSISAPGLLRIAQAPGGGVIATAALSPDRFMRRWFAAADAYGEVASVFPYIYWPAGTVFSGARLRVSLPTLTPGLDPTRLALPATGSPAVSSRGADVCAVPTDGWYRHDAGTVVVEFIRPIAAALTGLFAFPEAGFWGRGAWFDANMFLTFDASIHAGGSAASPTLATVPGRNIAALTWSGRDHRAAVNGALSAVFSTAADIPPPTSLSLGRGGGAVGLTAASGAAIQRVRFIPRALTEAELSAATTTYWEG